MVVKYRGVDKLGENQKGIIDATDLEDAKKRLKAKGIYYTKLEESNTSIFANLSFSRKRKLTSFELATLSRDLSIYLKAGISIVNALRLSKNQYDGNKKIASFLTSVINLLDEGKSFHQALEIQSIIELPSFYKQSIKVSENGGIMQDVLLELSIYLKEQDRVNKQISGAMFYPMFIAMVSFFIVVFMMAYVVPKITSMFTQMKQELPKITEVVITIGDFFKDHYILVFSILTLLVVGFMLLKKYNRHFKYLIDLFILKLPLLGKLAQTSDLGRFSYISSVLLRSGVPFVQTVNLSAATLNNSVLEDKFLTSSSRVVEGSKLSNALVKDGFQIDKSFVQAIALGEETSQLDLILKNLSDLYFEENRDKINIFLSLLEPMVMLIVGTIIAVIVIAMLLPIFSMNIG
jgi:general secretion pathway protein F/type IV pilus assembly protein PilC